MYTADTLNKWAGQSWERWNMLSVARNPRGVYEFIKKNYKFPFNWGNGYELEEANSDRLLDEINKAAIASGNPAQWAQMLNRSLPVADMYINNTIINRIEKVMRDNP